VHRVIAVENLTFDYPGTRALDAVNVRIDPGSITALVGPNGAGKTTLLRCIAALERPLTGSITVDGIDVIEYPRACHRRIGFLSDAFGLYADLTVRQCLRYVAGANLLPAERIGSAIDSVAGALAIGDRLDQRAGTLSRGLRQRVAIAQAIIHAPKLLILDEPASGLDPEARHELARLFRGLRGPGMTLVVSSHILAELEEYCTHMLVLRGGRVIEHVPLAAAHGATARMRVVCAGVEPGLADALGAIAGLSDIEPDGGRGALFTCAAEPAVQHAVLAELLARGLTVAAYAPAQRNLQDAYLATMRATPAPRA
jgi:ABC-2 type transport system ATP-binding protein